MFKLKKEITKHNYWIVSRRSVECLSHWSFWKFFIFISIPSIHFSLSSFSPFPSHSLFPVFLLLAFSLPVFKFIHFFKEVLIKYLFCEYFCFLSGSIAILWVSLTLGLDMRVSNHKVRLFSLVNYLFIYIDNENIDLIIKLNLKQIYELFVAINKPIL